MTRIIFGSEMLGNMGMEIPSHTQETLEHYLLRGFEPGGFITSMLAMDMPRALHTADTANRQRIWVIGRWIIENAPAGSWGSHENVRNWIQDVDGHRTAFATKVEKDYIVEVLSKP